MRSDWIRAACFAGVAGMVFYVFWAATPSDDGLSVPPPWDKVVHFLYYGLMAGLLAHGAGRRWLWLPLILVPAIGIADELNQAGIPGRDASAWDWAADLLGTIVAVALYRLLSGREPGKDRE